MNVEERLVFSKHVRSVEFCVKGSAGVQLLRQRGSGVLEEWAAHRWPVGAEAAAKAQATLAAAADLFMYSLSSEANQIANCVVCRLGRSLTQYDICDLRRAIGFYECLLTSEPYL